MDAHLTYGKLLDSSTVARLHELPTHSPHNSIAPPTETPSTMPTATHPTLDRDTIYDLLFLARTGETSELTHTLFHLAISLSTTPSTLLLSCIDPDSGNSTLHMASANGHTGTSPTFLIPWNPLITTRNDPHPPQTLNPYPPRYHNPVHLLPHFPTYCVVSDKSL